MLLLLSRYHQVIAWFFVALFYAELVVTPLSAKAATQPSYFQKLAVNYKTKSTTTYNNSGVFISKASEAPTIEKNYDDDNGPDQPEMKAFSSVNNSNMVDLFSGDFSYNIPLLDVGGYPVNLSYRGGISMDQEASWVGLGWSINPGTVNRNLRGLPDDFDGKYDSVTKVTSINPNRTVGVTVGAGWELGGLPGNLSASLGLFHNNYKGWGLETGLNASINAAGGAAGGLTSGLSLTNNTQEGFTISPSLSMQFMQIDAGENSTLNGQFSASLPYNSRSGLKGLQLSTGIRQYHTDIMNNRHEGSGIGTDSYISFASPAFTPTVSMPYTSKQISFTAKTGALKKIFDANLFVSGYVSTQRIAEKDKIQKLPAYGYLNYQNAKEKPGALLDFNLEKDMPYREKPPVPHIAIPSYTYDAFSITGEGTGGMFRAYRGDIGFVRDHYMRTKDESDKLSIDFAGGDIFHGGVDLNVNRAYSQNGAWQENNSIRKLIDWKKDTLDYEAVYLKNPSEKSINSTGFYNAIGGDDVVAVKLHQSSISSPNIQATNYLTRYRNKRVVEHKLLTVDSVYKRKRDKRTQVISYLTAKEAGVAGLSKYIENYTANVFDFKTCETAALSEGEGTGLNAAYYADEGPEYTFSGVLCETRTGQVINYAENANQWPACVGHERFCVRWVGRIKAPVSGSYTFEIQHDDGARLIINGDSLFYEVKNDPLSAWKIGKGQVHTATLNLLEGEFYDLEVNYYQNHGDDQMQFFWTVPGQAKTIVPMAALYPPAQPQFQVGNFLTLENRINEYRKPNHISEITVLNNDGRRYIYGIPVYNLLQRDVTFSVLRSNADNVNGFVTYSITQNQNSAENTTDKEKYFKSEELPPYAHSFLLTGIVSPDYVDVTSNGISDDDLGDAVKFNYSKIINYPNGLLWRTPLGYSCANYNEGLKSNFHDDKGSYVHGKKELWYLHSIESKTMVATFVIEGRSDLRGIDENGMEMTGFPKRLKQINLYSKADFAKYKTNAKPIKTVHFEYAYELCSLINPHPNFAANPGKLTLKKVWFTYNNNKKGAQNPYAFSYKNNQPYQLKSYDRWGNYKNPLQNPGSIPGDVIGNDEYPYAIQDSAIAAENAGAWNLDSIYLPSGGSIKVTYESDDYAYVQNKRAMQMFKPAGFASAPNLTSGFLKTLYQNDQDNHYIYFTLPAPVEDKKDFFNKYLQGIQKVYFKLFVKMPDDELIGTGSEYVSGYGNLEQINGYGISNSTTAWIKLSGISLKGDGPGPYSPMAKTAIQFLRLNLPGKAYPGSEPGDELDITTAVKLIGNSLSNIVTAFTSFDVLARKQNMAKDVDLNRSFIRLNNPDYKKYGGGHRVKSIKIYDNWNKMTQRRGSVYGQEYTYTTQKEINGVPTIISSGVASYEPGIGSEENPFRQPIEYIESSAVLGPVNLGYSEEPLGESFFPAPSIGYSKVRVRTINRKNARSANGFEETQFYTCYDYPTYTDRSLIDNNTKKRFKPALSNFLRINARHFLAVSQGFKVELNDMNGKLRSKAYYAETDQKTPIVYTENIYRTENLQSENKRLSNQVMAMTPNGTIDSTAIIGKDVELMVAFREQRSINQGNNINVNADIFSVPGFVPPVFVYPSFFYLYQREENLFRSAATTKVIQRYGILDSVIHIEKGSKVSTKDLLYDSETGDVLLSRTQNEFNDPVYNFTYPSHWAYDGMGLAYKNINAIFKNVDILSGKIVSPGINPSYFSSGDEILVAGKLPVAPAGVCSYHFSSFPSYDKIWVVTNDITSSVSDRLFFIDRKGKPYSANDVTLKIIRSGRRNILASLGSFTSLENPVKYDNGNLVFSPTDAKVVSAKASDFKQIWKIDDKKAPTNDVVITNCKSNAVLCGKDFQCARNCLASVYRYLTKSNKLYVPITQKISIGSLIKSADSLPGNRAYMCIMMDTLSYYYALTTSTQGLVHRFKMGDWTVRVVSNSTVNFSHLKPDDDVQIADTATLRDTVNYPSGGGPLVHMYIENYRDVHCDTLYTNSCLSTITDTTFNPYITGAAGNWRLYKNYTYHSRRQQSDPETQTNIRSDGAFQEFYPTRMFFNTVFSDIVHLTNWVWNSEMTLFNKKGFEIENKDPLGRYNAGLYGYNLSMPTAVVQNSRYRESGFDGFEDYDFKTQICDTLCTGNRQMDFSIYKNLIDSTVSHTGRHSIKVPAEGQASLQFVLSDTSWDARNPEISLTTASGCSPMILQRIKVDSNIVLPAFNPLKGRTMVISAWVRETDNCQASHFSNNKIIVAFDVEPAYNFYPNGPVIEGWQRIEGVFTIPEDVQNISVSLQATDAVDVNFDDVRIHPYNGNMKSFVFDPKNLRLMAELDENNYATFYEYDDDGTLIRLKKETIRGIKTIKETRSALLKD